MAERDYMRGKGVTPIQDMTTRQLRKYIRERTEEAQERLDSIEKDKRLDLEDMSLAFRDQLKHVQSFGTGRSGGIKKDTSRMSKEEMAEYAYAVRDLNMLDTESKYARDREYKEEKSRYEAFVREMASEKNLDPKSREYWKGFITEKKNVSKRGYAEYKEFVNFLRGIEQAIATYGYETVKDIYYDKSNEDYKEDVQALLYEVWDENKEEGMTPSQLIALFNQRLDEKKNPEKENPTEEAPKREAPKREAPKREAPKRKAPKKENKPKGTRSGKKSTSKKSKQNIKTKTVGKMKNGSVREKQTVKKF